MSDHIHYQPYRSKRLSTGNLHFPNGATSVITRSPSPPSSYEEKRRTPNGKALPQVPSLPLSLSFSPKADKSAGHGTPTSTSPTASSSSSPRSTFMKSVAKKTSTFRHVPFRNTHSSATSPAPSSVTSSGSSTPPHAPDLSDTPVSNVPHPDKDIKLLIQPPANNFAVLDAPSPQNPKTTEPSRHTLSGLNRRPPFRPAFQSSGLCHPLTKQFLALRQLKQEGKTERCRSSGMNRVERDKLTRRLDKLIDLHFPASESRLTGDTLGGPRRTTGLSASHNRRASSIFDLDIKNLSISETGDLWRGIVGSSKAHDIRVAEQRITPWQDDADVAKCLLCNSSFHPLTIRKHHCRLCGRIVCALPSRHPQRPAPCSVLFVVDLKTRLIEEVSPGVDYGVRKKGQELSADDQKFLRGVRICRSCRPILLRRQHQQEVHHIPAFAKLYEALITLEQEIEKELPSYHELLTNSSQLTKEVSATRKRLLEAFHQYDALARRIRSLPSPNGTGSSQDRIQMAILGRANSFLQKHMFSLQALPVSDTFKASNNPPDPGLTLDLDSQIAFALQPLLEQEALLETFVEEAKAQRKFEDVQTLKTNLGEIRTEINRLMANGQSNGPGNLSK